MLIRSRIFGGLQVRKMIKASPYGQTKSRHQTPGQEGNPLRRVRSDTPAATSLPEQPRTNPLRPGPVAPRWNGVLRRPSYGSPSGCH